MLDPAASRGTVAAQVTVKLLIGRNVPKDSCELYVTADLTNFAADNMLMGQKVEASALRVTASSDGYEITGDVKINGTPASHRSEQEKGAAGRRIAIAGDDRRSRAPPARHRFRRRRHRHDPNQGRQRGSATTATMPPMSVDADLTPVKIDNLLPGWVKPAGKPAHATYTLVKTGQTLRIRRSHHRRFGHERERLGRTRRRERHRVGEFSGVQPVGRRQGHRSRPTAPATACCAWRCAATSSTEPIS